MLKKILSTIISMCIISTFLCTSVLGNNITKSKVNLGDCIYYGKYTYDYETYPLLWEIVNIEGNVVTLMTVDCLAPVSFFEFNGQYSMPARSYNWDDSDVKKYLNTDFFESVFTQDEKEFITEYRPGDNAKVYLPSLIELGIYDQVSKEFTQTGKFETNYSGTPFPYVTLKTKEKFEHFVTRDISVYNHVPVIGSNDNKTIYGYTELVSLRRNRIRPVIKVDILSKLEQSNYVTKQVIDKTRKVYNMNLKSTSILINNEKLNLDNSTGRVKLINDKSYVPLRVLSESLGYNVTWDAVKNQVTVANDNTEVIFKQKEKKVSVNGDTILADETLLTIDSRTYVPLRFLSETLGAKVNYSNNCISITD